MRSATIRLPGHPDHACDLVAEAVIDEYVRRDPKSRVRISVTGGRGVMFVCGDVASQADFDVSALIKRTLGSLGVSDDVEPFISLEPVTAEALLHFRNQTRTPITVVGYAVNETPEGIPATLLLARRAAKRLHEKRQSDPEWFWLGPDCEVTVEDHGGVRVMISAEHGTTSLQDARRRIAEELVPLAEKITVTVNAAGAQERRGLAHACGASGRTTPPYGWLVPPAPCGIGHDPASVEKAGAWLARAAALKLVRGGATSALVRATYLPGDVTPSALLARDARGKDLSSSISPSTLSLERVMNEWWRSGLNVDAAKWGYAGEPEFPWES